LKSVVFETKLSQSTDLTDNQKIAKNNMPGDFPIRTQNLSLRKKLVSNINHTVSAPLSLSGFRIIYGNGVGDAILGLQ